jgi:hypothetical protein
MKAEQLMRAYFPFLALLIATGAAAGDQYWEVSEPDSFGWRRAVVVADDARLAIVCPPQRRPFAVPVVEPRPDHGDARELLLGLEIDGVRHDQLMRCTEIICEADLAEASWRALKTGTSVTIWFGDGEGPTLPLAGSAAALSACSPDF